MSTPCCSPDAQRRSRRRELLNGASLPAGAVLGPVAAELCPSRPQVEAKALDWVNPNTDPGLALGAECSTHRPNNPTNQRVSATKTSGSCHFWPKAAPSYPFPACAAVFTSSEQHIVCQLWSKAWTKILMQGNGRTGLARTHCCRASPGPGFRGLSAQEPVS